MRRIMRYFLYAALAGAVGIGSIIAKRTDNGGISVLKNTALEADAPTEELEEEGAAAYIVKNTKNTLSFLSNDTSTRTEWENDFTSKRANLGDGGIMIVDYSGSVINLSGDSEDVEQQQIRLSKRMEALSAAMVKKTITQDELFEYIRDYDKRGYLAVADIQDKIKSETNCEYDLRLDYIYVTSDNIYITLIYEEGWQTNMAINMSEILGFVWSLTTYL